MAKKILNWKDAFKWDNKLDDIQKSIRSTAELFSKKILQPQLKRDFVFGYDKKLFKLYGSNGFFDTSISPISQGLISQEIEAVDSGYRSAWSVQSSLVIHALNKFGTIEQKEKFMPELITGDKIGCFCLTESEAGSDPSSMKTFVSESNGKYIINGSKMWITNAPIANFFVIWAKNEESQVGGYIVKSSNPGIKTELIDNKLSLQTSPTGIVYLDNVVINKSDKLIVSGLKGPLSCLNKARYGIAWGSLGAARDCLEKTVEYVSNRKQFGKSLASYQLIQSEISDMITEWVLAMNACYSVGDILEKSNDPFSVENNELISLIKRNSTIKSLDISRRCRDIWGANGIIMDMSIMRHMCNLESVITYEGTKTMHLLNLGRKITGMSAI